MTEPGSVVWVAVATNSHVEGYAAVSVRRASPFTRTRTSRDFFLKSLVKMRQRLTSHCTPVNYLSVCKTVLVL